MDFILINMEEDEEISLILGRLFLATSGALIGVRECKVTMRVEDEKVTFNALKSMEFTLKVQTCNKLDDLTSNQTLMAEPRTNPFVITKPTKPPLDAFYATDPPPKV